MEWGRRHNLNLRTFGILGCQCSNPDFLGISTPATCSPYTSREVNFLFILAFWVSCVVSFSLAGMTYLKTVMQGDPTSPFERSAWVFFGRNDAKAETPVLWPPQATSWLIGKDPDAGRGWGQEEKGTTEDEMAGWHHRLDGHEFEWTLGVGDGQGGLACCNSWGRKESDTTEQLNWTELM